MNKHIKYYLSTLQFYLRSTDCHPGVGSRKIWSIWQTLCWLPGLQSLIRQSPNLYGPQILAKGKNILCDKVYKELSSISEISFAFTRGGEKVCKFS